MSAHTRPAFSRWIALAFLVLLVVVVASARGNAAPDPQFPAFSPTPGVVPEGVAVDRTGNIYISVRDGGRGLIWKFTRDGGRSRLADVGEATIGGLAVTANGDLYAAMATGPDQGVFLVDEGGISQRLPGTERILFANALAFDRRGILYITESYSTTSAGYGEGGIWRIAPDGEAELWLRHPLLNGIGAVLGYPVGANGIGIYHGDLYVVNTDKGLIVRIPVLRDGSPGEPEVWARLREVAGSPLAGSPFPLMADGLALDVFGNVYVTVISRSAVVRIDADDDRTQTTIAMLGPPASDSIPRAPFDTPASLAFGTGGGEQQHLFVTNLGWMRTIVPGPTWPGPGLVKVDAGAPGLPAGGPVLRQGAYNLGSWNPPDPVPPSALATGSSSRPWIGSLADR